MPSNRGLASHRAVSPVSDSNEFVDGLLATLESSDVMTGSCRFDNHGAFRELKPRLYLLRSVLAGFIRVPADPSSLDNDRPQRPARSRDPPPVLLDLAGGAAERGGGPMPMWSAHARAEPTQIPSWQAVPKTNGVVHFDNIPSHEPQPCNTSRRFGPQRAMSEMHADLLVPQDRKSTR